MKLEMKNKAYFIAALIVIPIVLVLMNIERMFRWLVGKLPL